MSRGKPPRKDRALLVFMKSFHTRCPLPKRSGAEADARKLFKVLSGLGFKVALHMDLTAQEVMDLYLEETTEDQGDCFLSVLSSHGEEGVVYGFDGCPVKLTDIFALFKPRRCPGLAGKTKMFFVQACRGAMLDPGVTLECDSSTDSQEDSFSHYLSIPDDTTVMFASSPGYGAFLNPSGSIFLQTLCELLSGEEHQLELSQLLTRVSHIVAYGFEARGRHCGSKEMPCIVTNMTREVFPFARKVIKEKEGESAETPSSISDLQPDGSWRSLEMSNVNRLLKLNAVEPSATRISETKVRTKLVSLNQICAGNTSLKVI
ncbi:caspase-3-like [Ambystoma mexicanum]|uniref:caspase-3-like n=1 Tax=Ambystoma mexicanum TaxID=8296 RepID=UPI0037E7E7D4